MFDAQIRYEIGTTERCAKNSRKMTVICMIINIHLSSKGNFEVSSLSINRCCISRHLEGDIWAEVQWYCFYRLRLLSNKK